MLNSLKEATALKVEQGRFLSATHEEIRSGATTDIYFVNTRDVLNSVGLLDTPVTAEIFTRSTGLFAGIKEVMELLRGLPVQVEALPEGEPFTPKETVVRIRGPYGAFGVYETVLLGILSSSCPAPARGPQRPASVWTQLRGSRCSALGRGIFTPPWRR